MTMNRRDFLKSTAALATAAAAGKAAIEPVAAPALFDLGDPKISNGTFNESETIGDLVTLVTRKAQEYADGMAKTFDSWAFDPPFRIEPIPDHIFVQWPPWRDK